MIKAIVLAISIAAVSGAAQRVAPRLVTTLQELTVPTERLPHPGSFAWR